MKKVVALICGITTLIIILLILLTVQGRDIRQTELDNAVDSSMEKAMSMLYAEDGLAPETNDELVALFMEALVVQIDSLSDLEVDVLAVDVEKGLLSVEARLIYTHPIGTKGVVTCMRTAIKDQYWDSGIVGDFSVTFLVDEEVFKNYTFTSGQGYIDPGVPEKEGYSFVGWKVIGTDDSEIVDITSYVADENRTFVAVFQEGVVLNSGLYDENDSLVYNWNELLNKGIISVSNNTLLGYNSSPLDSIGISVGTLVISSDITKICGEDDETVFEPGVYLEHIIVPDSVTSIGDNSFAYTRYLKSVTILGNTQNIGMNAFYFSSIEEISITNSVQIINQWAFDSCYNLRVINYSGTQEDWNSISFADDWNLGCPEITVHCTDGDIIIPAN